MADKPLSVIKFNKQRNVVIQDSNKGECSRATKIYQMDSSAKNKRGHKITSQNNSASKQNCCKSHEDHYNPTIHYNNDDSVDDDNLSISVLNEETFEFSATPTPTSQMWDERLDNESDFDSSRPAKACFDRVDSDSTMSYCQAPAPSQLPSKGNDPALDKLDRVLNQTLDYLRETMVARMEGTQRTHIGSEHSQQIVDPYDGVEAKSDYDDESGLPTQSFKEQMQQVIQEFQQKFSRIIDDSLASLHSGNVDSRVKPNTNNVPAVRSSSQNKSMKKESQKDRLKQLIDKMIRTLETLSNTSF